MKLTKWSILKTTTAASVCTFWFISAFLLDIDNDIDLMFSDIDQHENDLKNPRVEPADIEPAGK